MGLIFCICVRDWGISGQPVNCEQSTGRTVLPGIILCGHVITWGDLLGTGRVQFDEKRKDEAFIVAQQTLRTTLASHASRLILRIQTWQTSSMPDKIRPA
jgi:hypothetical protein